MKTKSVRHIMPSYFCLKNYCFDIGKLQAEAISFSNKYKNVLESNRELCSNNHELVETVYDHYEQVSLTTYNGSAATKNKLTFEDCIDLGKTAGAEKILSKHQKYKLKISQRDDFPELDERNYSRPTEAYIGSYIQSCVEQFNSPILRVRLVKLKAGKMVDWHIDYDPTFATRIIVPLITNEGVINRTKRSGLIEEVHMPATGHPWFINTGFSHSVTNNSKLDRVVLMFSLDAHWLLDQIATEWASLKKEELK